MEAQCHLYPFASVCCMTDPKVAATHLPTRSFEILIAYAVREGIGIHAHAPAAAVKPPVTDRRHGLPWVACRNFQNLPPSKPLHVDYVDSWGGKGLRICAVVNIGESHSIWGFLTVWKEVPLSQTVLIDAICNYRDQRSRGCSFHLGAMIRILGQGSISWASCKDLLQVSRNPRFGGLGLEHVCLLGFLQRHMVTS